MRDEPWWKQQMVVVGLEKPLIPLRAWTRLSPNDSAVAVMEDGFGERQQQMARLLLGDDVYESEVEPRLEETCTVRDLRRCVLPAMGLSMDSVYTLDDEHAVTVYPQLTPAFFDSLAEHLPEPCDGYIVDSAVLPHRGEENSPEHIQPYCQWLLRCWDAVLLPKWVQWAGRAVVRISMVQGLPQSYQTACLVHTLS